MRHRLLMTAALVAAVALLLAGCRQIEMQSRTDSNNGGSGKNGATAKSVQKVYVVQNGDTLYGIAQQECGDGSSVTALAQANVGRKQPDGKVMKNPDQIRVGWELVVSC